MRTKGEHIFRRIRRLRQRFTRLARRVAAWCVRRVLTRVQGGVMTRHMEEASVCAPAMTACCTPEKAETLRGLPSGKPVNIYQTPVARDVSARRPFALSVPFEIIHPRAIDARRWETGSDLLRPPPVMFRLTGRKPK